MAFIKTLELISLSEINNVVKYNPISGEFTWLKSYGARKIGGTAGTITTSGYLRIFINGRHYAAHRLAWIITFGVEPEGIIDHINGIKTDNRICNLRLATYSQNSMNSKINTLNKSGCKGVTWKKESRKWAAYGKLNGKKKHLGYFNELEDAKKAYCDFARKHHGEFYRSK
ncbi:HNH endonuclease [Escherichia coli]|nr:HNH endonuclease [Escherichia coli]